MPDEDAVSQPPAAPPHDTTTRRSRNAYTVLQVVSGALPLILAIVLSHSIWRQVVAEARNLSARSAELLTEHVARGLEVQDAVITAVRLRAAGMSWEEIRTSRALADMLTGLDAITPNTNRIGIIDPTGQLVQISNAAPPIAPVYAGDRDHVIALSSKGPDRAMLGRPVVSRTSQAQVIPYSRPRLGPDGLGDGGVVWVTFLPQTLAETFHRIALGEDDIVMLIRQDGVVLAHYPWRDLAEYPPLPEDAVPMRAMTAAGKTTPGWATGPGLFGEGEHIFAARTIPDAGAAILYGRSVAALHREWLDRSLGVIAVALLCSALLFYLARRGGMVAARELAAREAAQRAAEDRAIAEAARADAEARLRQNQRIDMLGQIAAGIVHDFRNTVQTVQAGAALIERALAQRNFDRVREVSDMLRDAAQRGGQLTQRLLSFRKPAAGDSCDPAETVAATCRLLQVALGASYILTPTLEPGLPARVHGSQAELDSAVMNLVINARDAMPEGGEITIALRPATSAPGRQAGAYLELSVTDTGQGMTGEILARATDAFFTTKATGGTGLGLASIRGFVEAVGGAMALRSIPGHGTTVTLWLPAYPA